MIGCLAYEFSSNDEILANLEPGDMVLYKGERYRWCGIEKMSLMRGAPSEEYIILSQDAKGKNGPSQLNLPYARNKHLIKPYLGASVVTDGRGIRKSKTNRTDFISSVLEIPIQDVPTALDLSVVVVADKNEFVEICRHLIIKYGQDKVVELTDVVPVSYFTGSGEQFQIIIFANLLFFTQNRCKWGKKIALLRKKQKKQACTITHGWGHRPLSLYI